MFRAWSKNVIQIKEQWYTFWPDWPTGTLRVDFRKKSVPQVKFVDVFIFALFLVF